MKAGLGVRVATISAMSEKLAREHAESTWPKEKLVSVRKKSRNLFVVTMLKGVVED